MSGAKLIVMVLAGASLASFSVTAAAPYVTSEYTRPGPSSDLAEDHARLVGAASTANAPEQIHIAYAGKGTMVVSWVTPVPGKEACTRVHFGTAPGGHNANIAIGTNESYSCQKKSCPADYVSGMIHHAELVGLAPSTTYFYRLGDTQTAEASDEFSFTTPPEVGPDVAAVYTLVGDLGQTTDSVSTLDHMSSSKGDIIIHVGDLSYADGYQPRWDTYGRLVQPVAAKTPWMTVEGNHEIESGVGKYSFTAYTARYNMGSNTAYHSLYYSFVHGSATWLMLGSYVAYDSSSAQYEWLQGALAAIDRKLTPWVFVGLHAPWYNSNKVHHGEGEGMRKAMEKMLYDAGVDVVFSGHVHSYERTKNVYNNQVDPCGPVYINIGDGGNREGIARPWMPIQPKWSAFREGSFGHGTLQVVNSSYAKWRWHRNQDKDSVTSDDVEVSNALRGPRWEDSV
ncbi:hypothetical protein CYMTET_31614 [Cymbomonas tetramitiformis]|uniref:Purple acid phosphatase n=1 Tax=Cymbomonas tetramitiformis TaxID=36881 RepID=A0AAE0FHJ2_9CHLO|nr:hypothetical protein CYMTET_31614 [Cymbomonas tetramitiformis]